MRRFFQEKTCDPAASLRPIHLRTCPEKYGIIDTATQSFQEHEILTMKRIIPFICGVVLLCGALVSCRTFSLKDKPNVVVIVIDTLRADHLPCYGYETNTAPFISALAARSVVFEHAYAASSWTSPATASIFTGHYPFQHGVTMGLLAQRKLIKKDPNIQINRIPAAINTMPEIFKKHGYRTFGASDNLNIGAQQGFDQGFDRLVNYMHESAAVINPAVLKFRQELQPDGRYFFYIHYNDPHQPYHHELPKAETTNDNRIDAPKNYDLEIGYVDRAVQELYERYGWDKNTLLIITADHGEELFEHGFYGHGKTLYNSVLHVPLIVHYPERIKAARISDSVSTVDILPTLIGLLGMRPEKDLAGMDLSPFIQDPTVAMGKRFLYSHLQIKRHQESDIRMEATIFRQFKFIHNFPDQRMLFNVWADPDERNDLIDVSGKMPRELESAYYSFLQKCKKFRQETVDVNLDQKKIDELRKMQYLH